MGSGVGYLDLGITVFFLICIYLEQQQNQHRIKNKMMMMVDLSNVCLNVQYSFHLDFISKNDNNKKIRDTELKLLTRQPPRKRTDKLVLWICLIQLRKSVFD